MQKDAFASCTGRCDMKFSKFVRTYEYGAETVLFNSYNKALVKIQNKYFTEEKTLNEDFPVEYTKALEEMSFFISDTTADGFISAALKKDKKLMISVEVSLACNMRCPYCYQGTEKANRQVLSDQNIKQLALYCEKISEKWDFESVVLKVLGGEPTANWSVTQAVIDTMSRFCRSHDKRLDLMIDTNGVWINDILKLNSYNSLLLTIPLSYKGCHDRMRRLGNDKGSYELIVSNIQRIHDQKPDIMLVLRHNTDADNIQVFDDYIKDLKAKLDFQPIIDISYTTELGDNNYQNRLSYEDYIKWKSNEAIDILLNNQWPIAVTPLMSTDRCQYRSKYSLKVFSDGTVGSCAMWFFKKNRMSLEELSDEPERIVTINNAEPERYKRCESCSSFFLCGGGYNLPCIQSLGIDECQQDGAYIIDLDSFIHKYMQSKERGQEKLFIGFNNKLVIR